MKRSHFNSGSAYATDQSTSRRDFLRSATTMAMAAGLPTLESLTQIANAQIGPQEVAGDYKALVCVFLFGGQDAANVLIPYTDSGGSGTNEYTLYRNARSYQGTPQNQTTGTGDLSYSQAQLAPTVIGSAASATGAGFTTDVHGRQFALHPSYTELKSLYDSGKLAVLANTGPLAAQINRNQYFVGGAARPALPVRLYSHDDQQTAWMSGQPLANQPTAGVFGNMPARLVDFNGASQISYAVSTGGINTMMLTSNPSALPYQIGAGGRGRKQITAGVERCNPDSAYVAANPTQAYCISGGPIRIGSGYSSNSTYFTAFRDLIGTGETSNNIYADQWRNTMDQSIRTEQAIQAALLASPIGEDIVTPFESVVGTGSTFNPLAAQLRMVAALIRASTRLGAGIAPMRRQVFFVSMGGFDTHGTEFWQNNPTLNTRISKAINAFWSALGNITVQGAASTVSAQERVTLFTMSEFGRTLDSNGKGSDHGWAGHHIVLGGAVNGGKIYGVDHNVTAAEAGTSQWMSADATAGAVPRVGIANFVAANAPGSRTLVNVPGTSQSIAMNHTLRRGEMMPTMASDAYLATLAQWFGVNSGELGAMFPNLGSSHPTFGGSGVGFMKP